MEEPFSRTTWRRPEGTNTDQEVTTVLREQFLRWGSAGSACALVLLTVLALVGSGRQVVAGEAQAEEIPWELRQRLLAGVRNWIEKQTEDKNSDGKQFKKGTFSRQPTKVDDSTYRVSVHLNTAEDTRQVTERYSLTLKQQQEAWEVAEADLVDTVTLLFRGDSAKCYKFEKLLFEREGLRLTASNGDVCEGYLEGHVQNFVARATDLTYSYEPPDHAARFPDGRDFHKVHQIYKEIHPGDLEFDPELFVFSCDPHTCDELLDESFPGLERVPADERHQHKVDPADASLPLWIRHFLEKQVKEQRENPFAYFQPLDLPENRYYSVFISRELENPTSGLQLAYNNWNEFEVTFSSWPKRWDVPSQLAGPIYGYFTEETLANSGPYELERREGGFLRWLHVHSVRGTVDLAVEEPELLRADIEYGLTLKQDMTRLPFFISAFDPNAGPDTKRPAPFSVDSVRLDGEELTWVQVGRTFGVAILPETRTAGSKINLGLSYSTRAIYKVTPSFSVVDRHSWLPFTRLGDYIEEYDLTIRSPARYEIYGSGKKTEDRVEGDLRVTRWLADKPVNGPSVMFGKYHSSPGQIEAKTMAGQKIPVVAHVDRASASDWGITSSDLDPIVNTAINSINLYTEISGFEYPFDELHLVNDPYGLLYGEARSGVIYLGQGVFKSEAALAPYFLDSTGIARFMRSVVAHEVGHMWWGEGITYTNSRNWWFVETMAEYFSALYLEAAYGYDDYLKQVEEWRRNIMNSNLKGSVQNSNTLFVGERGAGRTRNSRQAAIYDKGPYALHMLRETFKGKGPRGPDGADKKFFDFLKKFCLALREQGEVVTFDLQRAAEDALGGTDAEGNRYAVDLNWFFEQWIRGAGIPEYSMKYDVRQNEDGKFLIEGIITQQVLLGSSDHVLDGQVYRGYVDLTVKTRKGGQYLKRLVIDDRETHFKLIVPNKPLEVLLNEEGEMLAQEVHISQGI